MEKRLSEEILEKYRRKLLDEKAKIENLLKEIHNTQKEHSEKGNDSPYAIHQADVGSDTDLIEKRAFYIDKEIENLKKINYALKKIYDKEYGICENCGELISEERLKIVPTARYCIACKNEMEKKKKKR